MSIADLARLFRSSGQRYNGALIAKLLDELEPARKSGWVIYQDSVKTEGSPLSLSAGVRTLLTVDGLGTRTDNTYAEGISHTVWASNTFAGNIQGERFDIRVGLSVKTDVDMFSGITGLITALLTSTLRSNVEKENRITLELDFGAFTIEDSFVAPRKFEDAARFHRVFMVHTGSAVIDPGGQFYITATEDTEIYNVDLLFHRTYSPA